MQPRALSSSSLSSSSGLPFPWIERGASGLVPDAEAVLHPTTSATGHRPNLRFRRGALAPLACLTLALLTPPTLLAAEEEELLARIRSQAAIPVRAEACKELRLAGTARSVEVLAGLLNAEDQRLSQAARYALEGMPFPEATTALREALSRVSASQRIGIIDSLGWRRDTESVPMLEKYLIDVDDPTAIAAATALGRMGGPRALTLLVGAKERVPAPVARAVRESLLRVAEQQLAANDAPTAARIYRSLQAPTEEESIRQAAFAGEFRAAGDRAAALLRSALEGTDLAAQAAALRMAGEVNSPIAVSTLAELLPASPVALRAGLIAALHRRADPAAMGAVAAEAKSAEPSVRQAAVVALGTLGDASVVPLLLEAATSVEPNLQSAARDVLGMLPRGDVTRVLASLIPTGSPAIAREAFRALGNRGEPAATAELLRLARSHDDRIRGLALQTLSGVANASDLPALVDLAIAAPTSTVRDEVREVFESLIERRGLTGGSVLDPLVRSLEGGGTSVQRALLPMAALFTDDRLRAVFREAVRSPEESLQAAAIEAMAGTRDPALLPDLMALAGQPAKERFRPILLKGVVRLATDEAAAIAPEQRASALVSAYALAQNAGEKSTVIAGLSRSSHRRALETVLQAAADPSLAGEAEQAAIRIAQRLGARDFDFVESTLNRLASNASDASLRAQAGAALRQLDSGWWVCGPYRQDGKEAQSLFDQPFPPEEKGANAPAWRRVPGQTDPARAREVELGEFTGGNHCVLYVKSLLVSPEEREVTLSIGSDDGIKLWLNGQLIHANNAVRGLVSGQDRVNARLRAGANEVLAKITQHTAGCGLLVNVLGADGQEVPGVEWRSRAGAASPR